MVSLKDCTSHSSSDNAESHRRDNNISPGSKLKLMRSLVISIFLYACNGRAREKNAGLSDEVLSKVT